MPGKPRRPARPDSRTFVVAPSLPPPARGLASALHSQLGLTAFRASRVVRGGQVLVNGTVIRDPRHRLEPGDRVELRDIDGVNHGGDRPGRPAAAVVAARPHRPAILYADQQIAVVFKPSGLLTVPTPKREKKTLIAWARRELSARTGPRRLRVVQRLDREVSGVLVFALQDEAWEHLRKQFEAHSVQRRYLAIVSGVVKPAQGTFSSLLATGRDLGRYTVRPDAGPAGERAITHYRVKRQTSKFALVEVWLETGRRHQIRVHFAEAGHPVLGDPRYSRHQAAHPHWPAGQMALHAASLAFLHPATGRLVQFQSDMPWEFGRFLEQTA